MNSLLRPIIGNVRTDAWAGCTALCLLLGCSSFGPRHIGMEGHVLPAPLLVQPAHSVATDGRVLPGEGAPPSELAKVSLPEYILEPPDILLITVPRLVPKAPYFIQPGDALFVTVQGTPPEEPPLGGQLLISFEGTVQVGPGYEPIKVAGLTQDQANDMLTRAVQRRNPGAGVQTAIISVGGLQNVAGEHAIQPDGYVSLGIYGRVHVAGLSVPEARQVIEAQLSKYLDNPQAAVDIFSFNSKSFFVIQQNPLLGDNIVKLPIRGNETVMDALAEVGGLSQVSSKKVWIARPAPGSSNCDQVLPIDFEAITRDAATATNYQLLPGDRLFIAQDRMIAVDALISKVLNPFERMIGFSFLGGQTVQLLQRFPEGQSRF